MGFKLRPGTSVFGNVTFTPGTNENYVAPPSAPEPELPANWVVVGAFKDDDNNAISSGSVYVYDASDLSVQPTKLTAFDGEHDDWFGYTVAATANKVIVQAYGDDDMGSKAGAIYVFDTNDLSAQPTKLTAFDGTENDHFGVSIAANSDKIVVGAYGDDDDGSASGSVYVFDANDLTSQPTKLTAFDGDDTDYFGRSVDITSEKIVIGAYFDEGSAIDGYRAGSVYVYDANDLSAQPTKLTAFDTVNEDYFGLPVVATHDKIVVGAYGVDDKGSYSGAVYVYDSNDLSAQPTKLTAFDGAANDRFGLRMAATNDKIVVSAYWDNARRGSVYIYDANDLTADPIKLTAFDGEAYEYFGGSVDVSIDKIVVGAYADDSLGAVYIYDANDLTADPIKLTAFDGAQSDLFGYAVALG